VFRRPVIRLPVQPPPDTALIGPLNHSLAGALVMLYGSLLLIVESRLALGAITSEMAFVEQVSQKHGADIDPLKAGGRLTWLVRRIG
jgi:hypothetical protein